MGTDFNRGVHGIGPKKALALVRRYGRIEAMPSDIQDAVGDVDAIRDLYLRPNVTDDYEMRFAEPDLDGVLRFLCEEHQFSRDRVTAALSRAFPPNRLF